MMSDKLLGNLSILPNEILIKIFDLLSFIDLSNLTITNKPLNQMINNYYVSSKTAIGKLLPKNFNTKPQTYEDEQKIVKQFEQLGLFLKRLTCVNSTSERMKILVDLLNSLGIIPSYCLYNFSYTDVKYKLKLVGRMLQKFIAGWDNSECLYVFDMINGITVMNKYLKDLQGINVGSKSCLEYFVRMYYRSIFIDPNGLHDRFFWISLILHNFSNNKQRAQLFINIFGPLVSVNPSVGKPHVGWWDFTDSIFINAGLEEMGFALQILYHHSCCINSSSQTLELTKLWNKTNIINLIDNIITTPESWLQENIATLLYFSGDVLAFDYLETKLKKEKKTTEVSIMIVYLTLVNFKLAHDVNSVYDIIEKLQRGLELNMKINLFEEITMAFSDVISDTQNLLEIEDERDVTEVEDFIRAENCLMNLFMVRHFINQQQLIQLNNSQEHRLTHSDLFMEE